MATDIFFAHNSNIAVAVIYKSWLDTKFNSMIFWYLWGLYTSLTHMLRLKLVAFVCIG